jgi:hypothetical protein
MRGMIKRRSKFAIVMDVSSIAKQKLDDLYPHPRDVRNYWRDHIFFWAVDQSTFIEHLLPNTTRNRGYVSTGSTAQVPVPPLGTIDRPASPDHLFQRVKLGAKPAPDLTAYAETPDCLHSVSIPYDLLGYIARLYVCRILN